MNNRTKKVYLNTSITLAGQVVQVILGFVIRRLFISNLGVTYLGYNSVFANILQMLNLADMGIGVAVTSYLYKPLAENDIVRVGAIMAIYRKLYSILGIIVLIIGLVASLFLNILVPDATCSLGYLRLLFYINLIGTVSTYYLAYKRTLLIADQKSYLVNLVDTCISFIVSIAQIVLLLFFPNYIAFLILTVIKNIVSNILLSSRVNAMYGYINNKSDNTIVDEYVPQIKQYVKDVFVSRIGAVIYYSTDNIILSILQGSLVTGFLSNYTMITGQLNTIVTQVLSSVQATFGNYISTTEDKRAKMRMTDNYFCVNFCIGNFCMICFSLLAQPFIRMFFGENMLLAFSTAMWLGINLMLTFLIQLPSQVFIIYKLFRYDRPIIIVSAILNIIISVALVRGMGVNGVLIGTFVTSLIYLFSRFYIIARHVYEVKYRYYVKKIALYGLISLASSATVYFATKSLNGAGLKWFAVRAFVVGLLSIFSTAFFLSFTKEFDFLKNKLIPGKARKFVKSVPIGICYVVLIVCSIIGGVTEQGDYTTVGNKSYVRLDAYKSESSTYNNIFSLSFDDSILIFKDIADKNPKSIFENSTLNWYKVLHDKYGVVITCYVYYEDGEFNLTQVPEKYHDEFVENSSWLRFGFHTINGSTNYQTGEIVSDYQKTINELIRIIGAESIDNVLRLQMFQGSYDEVKKLKLLDNEPIVGLLTADDKRQSYYLDGSKNAYIYSHDEYYDSDLNLYLFSTDFRTEYVENIGSKLKELSMDSWNNQTGDLVVFSHEWALSVDNKEKIERVCQYAKEKGYRFEFFEDVIADKNR